MTDVLYELTDLSKKYTRGKESVAIFEDLTMTINRGDFIAWSGGDEGRGKCGFASFAGDGGLFYFVKRAHGVSCPLNEKTAKAMPRLFSRISGVIRTLQQPVRAHDCGGH